MLGIKLDTSVEGVKHTMNFALARQLCKVWEKKCGPLKQEFWKKMPFMVDAFNKLDSKSKIKAIKSIEKKCATARA